MKDAVGRWLERTVMQMSSLRSRPLLTWPISAGMFGLALSMRFAFHSVMPNGFPFLTFFPAVILSSFIGGRLQGVVWGSLSMLAAWYWFIPPFGSFQLDVSALVALLFFAGILVVDILLLDVTTQALLRLREEKRQVQKLLEERNVLFQDLQHRVANTLTLVSTVLASHQKRLKHNPEAVDSLRQSRQRFELMARIHRCLHDPAALDLPLQVLLSRLSDDFLRALECTDVHIEVQADSIELDLERKMTVALLTLELVTNALKHAFVPGSPGLIRVRVVREGDHVRFTVADNGRGLPADMTPEAAGQRLGMRISQGLAAALGGKLALQAGQPAGVCATVEFPA
jgi:two-component sensor histidine kinase